jgi:TIR domain
VAPKILFNERDWYGVVEEQAASFKRALESLPDDEALDETATGKLKEKWMLRIPMLLRDKMEFDEVETSRHRLGKHNLAVQMASQGQSPTEFVFHIPFEGDPAVFDIAPSASNGDLAQGEISDHKVLIRVQPIPGFDTKGHVDRELERIEWRLVHLRGGLLHLDQQLEIARRWCMKARKDAIDAGAKINRDFGIPRRKPEPVPVPADTREPVVPIPAASEKPVPDTWDIFMSHASPDKPWVRGLVEALQHAGVTVWFDDERISLGQPVRQAVKKGLNNVRYGIVVLSKAYLADRKWTEHELDGLFARERLDRFIILPIWHGVSRDEIENYDSALADRRGISATDGYSDIVASVLKVLGKDHQAIETNESQAEKPARPQDGSDNRDLVAYAWFEQKGPGAEKTKVFIRKSDFIRGGYVMIEDGLEHDGTEDDISAKFFVAHLYLKAKGFERTHFSNPSNNQAFNV